MVTPFDHLDTRAAPVCLLSDQPLSAMRKAEVFEERDEILICQNGAEGWRSDLIRSYLNRVRRTEWREVWSRAQKTEVGDHCNVSTSIPLNRSRTCVPLFDKEFDGIGCW